MKSNGARRGATAVAVFSVIAATVSVASTGSAAAATVCRSGVVGDVNGDGYAEVAVSSAGKSRSRGAVHLFYGGPSGLAVDATGSALGDQYFDQNSPGIPGTAKGNDGFGGATALGDLNGDGCADLAIGAPDDRAFVGSVTVLYGSPTGVTTAGVQFLSPDGLFDAKRGDFGDFGEALAIADLNHDGLNDLAIGVPSKRVNNEQFNYAGGVVVLFGDAAGLNRGPVGPSIVDQATSGVPSEPVLDEDFGTALAAGDFDGDGQVELAVGVTDEHDAGAGAGAVQLLEFDGDGPTATQPGLISQETPGVPGGGSITTRDFFGASLVAGDVNADGKDDLAVGMLFKTPAGSPEGSFGGAVAVLLGSAQGLTGAGSQVWSRNSPGIEGVPNEGFGFVLAMGRLDTGATDDLVIGAPFDAGGSVDRAGSAVVLFGGADGLTSNGALSLHQGSSGVGGVAEAGDAFSTGLTVANVQSSTQASLVIGVPGEKIGTHEVAGQIQQLSISPGGPTATGSRILHLSVPGVKGVARTNGAFGLQLS